MHPILEIGPWRVQAWGFLNATACIVVVVGALSCARHRHVDRGLLVRLWPWLIVGGLVGGHVYYLLAASDVPLSAHTAAEITDVFRGQAIQGGFVGGALAALVYLRLAGAPSLAVLDVLSPPGAAAQALTRVGCFLAGCCYGRPAPAALSVVYTDPASLGPLGVPIYPAQLFESALLLVLAATLYIRLRRPGGSGGDVFTAYLGGYGAIRFLVQFFRGDDADRLFWGLAHSQYAAIAMIAAALLLGATHARLRVGGVPRP